MAMFFDEGLALPLFLKTLYDFVCRKKKFIIRL